MARWLGLDHGTKRIGLAVGETTTGIATPLEVISAKPFHEVIRRILDLAEQYGAGGIVVGWPLNMDDTEGDQARLARRIARDIAHGTHLAVRIWDERLSSFAADKALAGYLTRKQKKARQDAVAAASMLADFLACDGPTKAPSPEESPEPSE